jgi:hypothetical protein
VLSETAEWKARLSLPPTVMRSHHHSVCGGPTGRKNKSILSFSDRMVIAETYEGPPLPIPYSSLCKGTEDIKRNQMGIPELKNIVTEIKYSSKN